MEAIRDWNNIEACGSDFVEYQPHMKVVNVKGADGKFRLAIVDEKGVTVLSGCQVVRNPAPKPAPWPADPAHPIERIELRNSYNSAASDKNQCGFVFHIPTNRFICVIGWTGNTTGEAFPKEHERASIPRTVHNPAHTRERLEKIRDDFERSIGYHPDAEQAKAEIKVDVSVDTTAIRAALDTLVDAIRVLPPEPRTYAIGRTRAGRRDFGIASCRMEAGR